MWVGELSFGCTLKTDKKQRVVGGAAAFDKDENEEQRQPASRQPAVSGATRQRVRLTGQKG